MEASNAARLKMLAAALLFSTGGAAIKACGLGGWQIACFRSAIAAVALWVFLPLVRRRPSGPQGLVALAYAGTLILYVLANKLTTAANAIFLQSTAPLYLLLISPFLLRERIRARDLFFMAALACGLVLYFAGNEAPQRTAPNPLLGNVLGACSAITWAFTVAGLRWIARSEGPSGNTPEGAAVGAAFYGNMLVFFLCLPLALPLEGASGMDWVWVAYLGIFQIGLAYVFMTSGVRRVTALEGALLLLVEPVLNAVWAWLFHGETPGPWSRAGALVILLATVWRSLRASRLPKSSEKVA